MLHPFTPFVTEELWGHLKAAVLDSPLSALAQDWPEMLITVPWPETQDAEGWEDQVVTDFGLVQEIVRAIRNLRAEKGACILHLDDLLVRAYYEGKIPSDGDDEE